MELIIAAIYPLRIDLSPRMDKNPTGKIKYLVQK